MSTEKPDSSPASLFRTGYQPERHANRRRTGSRAKLAKRFFEDTYAAWEEQGESALARAAFHDPMGFVSMVARLMPQKIEVSTPTDGMSDERLAEMLEVAERMAAIRAGQVIDATPLRVAALPLAHEPADENALCTDAAEEGGGGPDRAHLLGGVNTSSALRPPRADTPVAEHNVLNVADAPRADLDTIRERVRALPPLSGQKATEAETSVAETPSLPYPVGRPFAKPDHVVERENRRRIAEAEDDIDPASLF
jgi:hypothetical protein